MTLNNNTEKSITQYNCLLYKFRMDPLLKAVNSIHFNWILMQKEKILLNFRSLHSLTHLSVQRTNRNSSAKKNKLRVIYSPLHSLSFKNQFNKV